MWVGVLGSEFPYTPTGGCKTSKSSPHCFWAVGFCSLCCTSCWARPILPHGPSREQAQSVPSQAALLTGASGRYISPSHVPPAPRTLLSHSLPFAAFLPCTHPSSPNQAPAPSASHFHRGYFRCLLPSCRFLSPGNLYLCLNQMFPFYLGLSCYGN